MRAAFSLGRRVAACSRSRTQSTLASAPLFQNVAKSSNSIPGRATVEGTKQFVADSELNMFHRFVFSKLFITPVIHGAPTHYDSDNQKYIETLTMRAVVKNRSNCVVIYEDQLHKQSQALQNAPSPTGEALKPYYFGSLDAVLRVGTLTREQIVTVANLGAPATKQDIEQRFREAKTLSRLECIDLAFFEMDDEDIIKRPQIIEDTIETLTGLANKGELQSFGIKVSVSPFKYHNPPPDNVPIDLASIPEMIEKQICNGMSGCDFVVYPISPTIAIPTTYPMMEANVNIWKETEEDSVANEQTRQATRIASDPFTIKRGLAWVTKPSDEVSVELVSGFNEDNVEKNLETTLDSLCPQLKDTPRLQDKALRIVFSVGVDAVMVDAENSGFMGKFALAPKHMLSSDDTEHIFGSFAIPMAHSDKPVPIRKDV